MEEVKHAIIIVVTLGIGLMLVITTASLLIAYHKEIDYENDARKELRQVFIKKYNKDCVTVENEVPRRT